MDTKRFEKILNSSENSTLDFKSSQYNILNDKIGDKTAEFIKDIISFANTIRNESAYIIIGIEESKDGTKKLLGLNENIDDAIFQQKIKDKVNPKPVFAYSTYEHKGKRFGIFKIPINYYPEPITPIKKLKGLEIGRVYFRRGSSNSEANLSESIKINDWLRTLNRSSSNVDTTNELSKILSRLNDSDSKLAPIAVDSLRIAKQLNNLAMIKFFNVELSGWKREDTDDFSSKFLNYRKANIIFSSAEIKDITTNIKHSAHSLYKELLHRQDFQEVETFFNQPIVSIETELVKMKQNDIHRLYYEKRDINDFLPNRKLTGKIMIYYIYDTYFNLLKRIRNKYIYEIMNSF